eukprot:SAG11_NODE_1817_length_4215_cov_1.788630_6_plen_110_part_00
MPKQKGKGKGGGKNTKPKAGGKNQGKNQGQGKGKGNQGKKTFQPNYSQSTKKVVDRFLQERAAAKRQKQTSEAIREQGAVLFASAAEAQASQMVKRGVISKKEKKTYAK